MTNFISISLLCFGLISCSATKRTELYKYDDNALPVLNIKDLGARGDGKSDDYAAFAKAIQIITKHKGGTLILPKANYYIGKYNTQAENVNLKYENLCFLEIIGNNSKIMVNGNFHRNITRIGSKNKFSEISACIPFFISNSDNVTIRDLSIFGGIERTTKDKSVKEGNGHLILLRGCVNIRLQNLVLERAQTDGLCISFGNRESENLTAKNVKSRYNSRMGLTIGGLKGGLFEDCTFSYSGYGSEAYEGHAPRAGIDIEPNRSEYKVQDIRFDNCNIENNKGGQILLSHISTTKDIKFNNCIITSSKDSRRFAMIGNARSYAFTNCYFDLGQSSIYPVWHKDGVHARFTNCIIRSSSQGMNIVRAHKNSSVTIDSCKFIYSGSSILTTYFPFIRMRNVRFTNSSIDIPLKYLRKKKPSVILENISIVSNLNTSFPLKGNVIISNSTFEK